MKSKIFGALLGLAVGATATIAQAETVLRLGSVAPSGSPWGAWMNQVAEELEKVSGGEMKLNLLLDGQIGDEVTMVRQAMKGRLDMVFVSNDPLAVVMPEAELVTAPYLFDTVEQGTCVQHKYLADIMGPLMAENSLVPISWMEVGHTIMFSRDKIRMPEDLAGKKVRVANGIVKRDYISSLGTTPSPLSVADTIPALQTGTIDAVNFPAVYGIAVGVPKLAPNVLVTNHFRVVGSVAISERSWNKLSDQEKEWLMSIAPMGEQLTGMILGAEKALLAKTAEAGADVHMLTAEEEAAWRASAEGSVERSVEAIGGRAAAVLQQLEEAKAACGTN